MSKSLPIEAIKTMFAPIMHMLSKKADKADLDGKADRENLIGLGVPASERVYIVNIVGEYSDNLNTYTADKTYKQLLEAASKGYTIIANALVPVNELQSRIVMCMGALDGEGDFVFSGYDGVFVRLIFITLSKKDRIAVDDGNNGLLPIVYGKADGSTLITIGGEWVVSKSPTVFSPSGKQFSITVDDSGTLTATEVT